MDPSLKTRRSCMKNVGKSISELWVEVTMRVNKISFTVCHRISVLSISAARVSTCSTATKDTGTIWILLLLFDFYRKITTLGGQPAEHSKYGSFFARTYFSRVELSKRADNTSPIQVHLKLCTHFQVQTLSLRKSSY